MSLRRIWYGMIQRCTNTQNSGYKYYGARGISVCERWLKSFEAFATDMGPRPTAGHSIDRYPDNRGNYAPDNCRWATHRQQANNTTRNIVICALGESLTATEWSERMGISTDTVRNRFKSGIGAVECLSKQRLPRRPWGSQRIPGVKPMTITVPRSLHIAIKARAAAGGITIKQFVINALSAAVSWQVRQGSLVSAGRNI